MFNKDNKDKQDKDTQAIERLSQAAEDPARQVWGFITTEASKLPEAERRALALKVMPLVQGYGLNPFTDLVLLGGQPYIRAESLFRVARGRGLVKAWAEVVENLSRPEEDIWFMEGHAVFQNPDGSTSEFVARAFTSKKNVSSMIQNSGRIYEVAETRAIRRAVRMGVGLPMGIVEAEEPITEGQIKALWTMARRLWHHDAENRLRELVRDKTGQESTRGLSMGEAQELIDQIAAMIEVETTDDITPEEAEGIYG